jgi:succinate dehydrogenase/fumarate reductase flavoprotein subunit
VSLADAEERASAARAPLGRATRDEVVPLRAALRDLMWEHAGLVRTGPGLQRALAALEELAPRLDGTGVPGGPEYNLAWQAWLDTRNQALAARLIVRSALERRESRGAHYRRDHPEPDDARWLINVLAAAEPGGELRVWTEPVRLTRARPSAAPRAMVEIGD